MGGRGGGRGAAAAVGGDPSASGTSAADGGGALQQQQLVATVSIFASIKDEYDPMKPNDYEQACSGCRGHVPRFMCCLNIG
jgi:hypothetical protein